MNSLDYAGLSSAELAKIYIEVGIAQDDALLNDDKRRFNRLCDNIVEIERELRVRPGDGRRALLQLHDHWNDQVRLNAAGATLAIAPEASRQVLVGIRRVGFGVQSLSAGMLVRALDDGSYVPS